MHVGVRHGMVIYTGNACRCITSNGNASYSKACEVNACNGNACTDKE
jgi:hypothetical protein